MKSGNKYRIKHNNKDYGEFSKLSDALYERDCLFYCKFDYDLLVECDLPNKYENMELPPFPESRPRGQIKGNIKFNNGEKAVHGYFFICCALIMIMSIFI